MLEKNINTHKNLYYCTWNTVLSFKLCNKIYFEVNFLLNYANNAIKFILKLVNLQQIVSVKNYYT